MKKTFVALVACVCCCTIFEVRGNFQYKWPELPEYVKRGSKFGGMFFGFGGHYTLMKHRFKIVDTGENNVYIVQNNFAKIDDIEQIKEHSIVTCDKSKVDKKDYTVFGRVHSGGGSIELGYGKAMHEHVFMIFSIKCIVQNHGFKELIKKFDGNKGQMKYEARNNLFNLSGSLSVGKLFEKSQFYIGGILFVEGDESPHTQGIEMQFGVGAMLVKMFFENLGAYCKAEYKIYKKNSLSSEEYTSIYVVSNNLRRVATPMSYSTSGWRFSCGIYANLK